MDMDVTLPRALDIKTFVQARDAEVATLLNALKEHCGEAKYGAAALARHLRRRATSHQRYLHIRRPNVRLATLLKKQRLSTDDADAEPGHAETAMDGRSFNRAMRRRPARMAQPATVGCAPELQLREVEDGTDRSAMHVDDGSAGEPSTSAAQHPASQSKSHWLETHTWHARRMRMHSHLWGHALALQAPGKGRGSRSMLHQLRTKAIMHDASYWGCLQLSGHQRDIAQLLKTLTDPAVLSHQLQRAEVHCGAAEWGLTLHTPHTFPAGALAPVKLLWVPLPPTDSSTSEPASDSEGWYTNCLLWVWVHAAAFQDVASVLQAACQDLNQTTCNQHTASCSQPVGSDQAGGEGQQACSTSSTVSICSLSAQLRRLEVLGGEADIILQQVVTASRCGDSDSCSSGHQIWSSAKAAAPSSGASQQATSSQPAATTSLVPQTVPATLKPAVSTVSGARQGSGNRAAAATPGPCVLPWPDGCVLGVTCEDPRLADVTDTTSRPAPSLLSAIGLQAAVRAWPESGDWTDGAHALLRCAAPAAGSASAPVQLPRPHSDAAVGQMRTAARRRALQLPPVSFTAASASARPLSQLNSPRLGLYGGAVLGSLQQRSGLTAPAAWQPGQVSSNGTTTTSTTNISTQCPVLLVRRQYGELPGWSIIVPAGWVMPFWLRLAFSGARPAGQLEWRWAATQAGISCFPWDWPHTPAGTRSRAQMAAEFAMLADKRPMGKAPKAPGLPYIPWQRTGTEAATEQGTTYMAPGVPKGHAPSRHQQQGQQAQSTGQGAASSSSSSAPISWQVLCTKEQLRAVTGSTGSSPAGSSMQVWAWVSVTGKGRCEEGAEISVDLCPPALDSMSAAATVPASIAAASTAPPSQGQAKRLVLGFVLRAAPRGIKPRGAWGASHIHGTSYPGGLAICDAAALIAAGYAQSKEVWQGLSTEQQLKRARHGSKGAHGAFTGLQPVRVHLRNPGSAVARNASLVIALAPTSAACATMPCL